MSPVPVSRPTSVKIILILSSHLRRVHPNGLVPWGFQTKTLCISLISYDKWFTHIIRLDFLKLFTQNPVPKHPLFLHLHPLLCLHYINICRQMITCPGTTVPSPGRAIHVKWALPCTNNTSLFNRLYTLVSN